MGRLFGFVIGGGGGQATESLLGKKPLLGGSVFFFLFSFFFFRDIFGERAEEKQSNTIIGVLHRCSCERALFLHSWLHQRLHTIRIFYQVYRYTFEILYI